MEDANRASKEIDVQIIGGHTEVTNSVNRPVISATAIGKVKKISWFEQKTQKSGRI